MSELESWQLPELVAKSGVSWDGPVPKVPIRWVTDDSREVRPDTLFIAVKGAKCDGHRFIAEAVQKGARVILLEEDHPVPPPAVRCRVPQTRPLLGPLVHTFLKSPSERLKMVGVTGTNGKTTVTWILQHLLGAGGISCGLIGTICCRVGSREIPSKNTTPGAAALQGLLSEMVDSGTQACAMEVSSHALDQHRTDGIRWRSAVFTNLNPEHLDYHQTLERYLKAKLRLFEALGEDGCAVLNQADPASEQIRKVCRGKILTYSTQGGKADLTAKEIWTSLEGTVCDLTTPEGTFSVAWRLVGQHNVENLLAALGAVIGLGIPLKRVLPAVSHFSGVPGRLERMDDGNSFPVFVDYAHTDSALQRTLMQLQRAAPEKRILVVFGCGGDRDRAKRPRMGRVAATLAHRVIVTNDNPRSEDPEEIAREITEGLREGSAPWEILLDRREAIRKALESADGRWLVLIAGKGHETGQILKERTVAFDDRTVVRELLSREFSTL